ncbi:MAG TPA: hypothetical protein VF085_12180 [Solirubrobacterales bacterium]
MPGLRCDGPDCNDYLLYKREIVAVRIDGAGLRASVELEDTPSRERPAPVGRYHPACYAAARAVDDRLPAPSD